MSHFSQISKMKSLINELGGITLEEFTKKAGLILDALDNEYEDLDNEKEDFEDEVKNLKSKIDDLENKIEHLEDQVPFPGKMTVRDEFMINYLIGLSKKYTLKDLEDKLGSYIEITI
jgi:predicted  nucleic acid-binding Zn-ribbon protein